MPTPIAMKKGSIYVSGATTQHVMLHVTLPVPEKEPVTHVFHLPMETAKELADAIRAAVPTETTHAGSHPQNPPAR